MLRLWLNHARTKGGGVKAGDKWMERFSKHFAFINQSPVNSISLEWLGSTNDTAMLYSLSGRNRRASVQFTLVAHWYQLIMLMAHCVDWLSFTQLVRGSDCLHFFQGSYHSDAFNADSVILSRVVVSMFETVGSWIRFPRKWACDWFQMK